MLRLQWDCLTFVGEFQVGEFRRFSEGDNSERGRGVVLDMFFEDAKLFLANRSGCTWGGSTLWPAGSPGLAGRGGRPAWWTREAGNLRDRLRPSIWGPITPRSKYVVAVEYWRLDSNLVEQRKDVLGKV